VSEGKLGKKKKRKRRLKEQGRWSNYVQTKWSSENNSLRPENGKGLIQELKQKKRKILEQARKSS